MHKDIAKELLPLAGGKENIINITHCTTRLRFEVRDETKIDIAAIENMQSVQGTFFRYGLFQIIFGAGIVNKIYKEVIQLCQEDQTEQPIASNHEMNVITRFAKTLYDIFFPIIHAIVASGLLMGHIGRIKV
ncbi:PTS transporter subunit EIIB, partial [Bacillus atrophaeus]|uniref:PTS transporter subunit EIIB n=1 Tax=Bacillus atrophaeus TaxID=1452 RepID=UPI002E1C283F|nr:PTS transporter subunit EIIB [Bacillus atrophaeus]